MVSTIDLIILGILTETPMNAYELTQYIGDRQVASFLKISDPAIYKSCKRLLHEGFLNGRSVREGNQPSKTIYSINSDGREKFHELMRFYSTTTKPWSFEFNTFIWHLGKLDKKQGLKMLRNLGKELRLKEMWFKNHERELTPHIPFPAKMILKQHSMTLATLVAWVDGVTEDYKKLKSPIGSEYNVSAVKQIHENLESSNLSE